MAYQVVESKTYKGFTEEWLELETEDMEEAIEEANYWWERMTDYDRKYSTVEVREMANEFDYDVVWSSDHNV